MSEIKSEMICEMNIAKWNTHTNIETVLSMLIDLIKRKNIIRKCYAQKDPKTHWAKYSYIHASWYIWTYGIWQSTNVGMIVV